jgi:hypothetical protein
VAVGIVAILAALAQVRADRRKDHIHELAAEAQTKLHDLFRSTDYLLRECGVDRTYVINQTNEDPSACIAPIFWPSLRPRIPDFQFSCDQFQFV